MSRFFIEDSPVQPGVIRIKGEDVNHIRNVLRSKIGDTLTLSNGKGTDYTVRITRFDGDSIEAQILGTVENKTEPPIYILLFQGLPKSDKMDLIIQKAVELGVGKVVPFMGERTVVKLDNPRDSGKKVARWQKIALEAAKQSNRGIIPEIAYPVSYKEALDMAKGVDLALIPYEKELQGSLKKVLSQPEIKSIALFIGPEGGFTEKEVTEAIGRGIRPVTLGPRILRTETAGLAAISMIQYELGDVNF